jgi:hypothetical protein
MHVTKEIVPEKGPSGSGPPSMTQSEMKIALAIVSNNQKASQNHMTNPEAF